METELSKLKLLIEKGPREGEVLEFNSKPRLTIRIGRVLRGDTVAIKENGVSSKHLSIDWSDPGKWIVKDLNSSNGTFLNASLLQPLTIYDLRDGDEIKIGKLTSIRVRILCVSNLQLVDRNPRRGARVFVGEKSDDGEIAEEGNRRERGRGRGQGRHCGDEVVNFAHEASELGVSSSLASVNSEVNRDCNLPEVRVRRGRSRYKDPVQKDRNSEDEGCKSPTVYLETDVNMKGIKQKRGRVSKRKNMNLESEEDDVEIVGQRLERPGDVECKAGQVISLRRSSRRIPEASQLVDSVKCEMVEVVHPVQKLNTRARRVKKNKIDQNVTLEDKESKEELNGGEQVSRETVHDVVQQDEPSASEPISVQENCMELEQPCEEPMAHIVKNDGKLACELNFEDGTGEDVELNLNLDDNIGGTVSEESTADDIAAQKDAEATIDLDWKNMTLEKWFDRLERLLPKLISAEADQIIEDTLKRSQQFHEFLFLQKKQKIKPPLA